MIDQADAYEVPLMESGRDSSSKKQPETLGALEKERNPRHWKLVAEYVVNKTPEQGKRTGIVERVLAFEKDSAELFTGLDNYDNLKITTSYEESNELRDEFVNSLYKKTSEKLKGQESKLVNAKKFIEQMTDFALLSVLENASAMDTDDPDFATKIEEQIRESLRMVSIAVEAINFQDVAASMVSLGDHGWHHLFQDFRDSLIIAEGLKGDKLTARESLIMGLSSAFHDIGYSSNQVSGEQRVDSSKYGLDTGHPVLSFAFLNMNKEAFLKVLSQEEFEALLTIVINHENPEKASDAGEYQHLAKAFAHADAGASIGPEKVFPAIGQVPELMRFIYHLSQAKGYLSAGEISQEQYDRLVSDSKQEVQQLLDGEVFSQEQSEAIMNIFSDSHLFEKSLNFILGRLTGEMGEVTVDASDGRKQIVFEMKMGNAKDIANYLPGAVEAGAKIATKVFAEQAGIKFTKDQIFAVETFLLDDKKEQQSMTIDNLGIRLNRADNSRVFLETSSVKVVYNPEQKAKTYADYYEKLQGILGNAQQELTNAQRSHTESSNKTS